VSAWRRIALTGASSGIGRALAERLAAPGRTLLLTGRDAGRLDAAAAAARSRGATVETAVVDVTDRDGMARALGAFDAAGPVDLLIANAGVSSGRRPGGEPETPEDARRVIATNLIGAFNTVEPLADRMAARGAGQIALTSSLAASRPLADMPAYSASKAALRAWGVSLRGALGPRGVAVTVICPGFVTSPMSARHAGFKPFEISADRAARHIERGLARRAAFVSFPWPLVLLTWLDARLPPALSDRLARGFAAEIAPETDADVSGR
jgi:short-subunit dehydrogenase